MSLCLSMIVKNESRIIRRALRSVKPFIDCYSISDTGSTDDTMDIIREELADIPGVLTSDAWQNFGHNRNVALANSTGDWALRIDADEVLEYSGGPIVLDPRCDGFHLLIRHNETLSYWDTRIVRVNDPRWEWKGVTHEALFFDGEVKMGRIENISVKPLDDSSRRITGNKFLDDLRLLQAGPQTSRNVFYLGQTLWALGRHEEAIEKYRERVAMGDWEEEVYYSLWQIGNSLHQLRRPIDEIAAALFRAYIYRPTRYEALLELCEVLRENRLYDEAYRLSNILPRPSKDILFLGGHCQWRIVEEHGLAAFFLDRLDEAVTAFSRLSSFDIPPEDRERIEANIAQCEQELQRLARRPLAQSGTVSIPIPPAPLRLILPEDTEKKRELAMAELWASQECTADSYVRLSLINYQVGRYQECIEAAKKAVEIDPKYAEAFNNISAAHIKLSQWDLAIDPAREAIRLKPGFGLARNNLAVAIQGRDHMLEVRALEDVAA